MTDIIDRRNQKSSRGVVNRKKFIDRHKDVIKEQINRKIDDFSIKKVLDHRGIVMPGSTTRQPVFGTNANSGSKDLIVTGNNAKTKGDRIKRPPGGNRNGRAGNSGEGEVGFDFILTKKEFLNLLFEDLELPDYVKESISDDSKYKWINAGYSPDGPMTRLSLSKTFQNSLARRFAARGSKRKVPFLDDIDLRFRLKKKEVLPIRKAVMFCVQDVSFSMDEGRRDLAKRFFLLLYVFLEQKYDSVEIVFIKHTTEASETDEYDFFYSRESGGTCCSTAFKKVNEIITERYNHELVNIYIAQASDGDNWPEDNDILVEMIEDVLLPKIQYMAYIQVANPELEEKQLADSYFFPTLWALYKPLVEMYEKFNRTYVTKKEDIFNVFSNLFKKGK